MTDLTRPSTGDAPNPPGAHEPWPDLGRFLTPPVFWLPERFVESAWLEHAPFAFWIVDAHRPRTLVELGTHNGFSYLAFCQAIDRLDTGTRAFAVDHWHGDADAGFFGPEVLRELRKYHDPRYRGFSQLIESTFDDAVGGFDDGEIDLLHIDGTHRLDAVENDVNRWLPKLSNRGVILFHDICVREGEFGVHTVWNRLKQRYPHFEFDHGYGLGVLGVGAESSRTLGPLFRLSSPDAAAVRQAFARLGAGVADRALLEHPSSEPAKPAVTTRPRTDRRPKRPHQPDIAAHPPKGRSVSRVTRALKRLNAERKRRGWRSAFGLVWRRLTRHSKASSASPGQESPPPRSRAPHRTRRARAKEARGSGSARHLPKTWPQRSSIVGDRISEHGSEDGTSSQARYPTTSEPHRVAPSVRRARTTRTGHRTVQHRVPRSRHSTPPPSRVHPVGARSDIPAVGAADS